MNKHRGRSFMSSRVLRVTKGLSTFQLLRITLGGDIHTNPGPANSPKNLYCFYQNARSLKAVCFDRDSYVSKLQLLQDLTYGFDLDIVCLTETSLNESISDFEILPTGYDIYRKNRQNRTGGGVLFAIKSSHSSSQVCFTDLSSEFEVVMVEIENLKCKRKILILSCYRPPNDASPTNVSDENDVEDFYEVLESLTRRIPKHNMLIVGGDFNAHLGQQDGFKNSYHQQTNRNGSKMKDYLQANDLISLNTTFSKRVGQLWTHEGPNGNRAQLDYLLINRKWRNSAKNCRAFNSFVSVSSDHRIVSAQIRLTLRANKKKPNSITCYDWSVLKNDANVAASFVTTVNNRFAILQDSIQTISANNTYKSFETACREAADAIIPQKTKVKTRKPWENEEFHQKRQLLHQAQQIKESLPSPENIRLFNEARLSLKEAYRDEQKIYLESKVSQIRNSATNKRSAEAWKTVNEITGRISSNSSKLKAASQEERIQLWNISAISAISAKIYNLLLLNRIRPEVDPILRKPFVVY
ncbi:uncharacterized protein [Montipora capricornis]|uniref:uncharacterized protein n=1 Tax=Montipora capricornis TaxID=246305 RepID=UPI0035F1A80D